MKKTLLAAALALASAVATATTTVGIDYSYARADGRPYLAAHTVVGSVKQSLDGWGNIKLGVGGAQTVTSRRDNAYVVGAEYSYDFATPVGQLSPAIGVQRLSDSGVSANTATVSVLLRTPVADSFRLVTGAGYTRGIGSTTGEVTTVGVGAEFDLSKSLTLKAGYMHERLTSVNRRSNGLTTGVEFKF